MLIIFEVCQNFSLRDNIGCDGCYIVNVKFMEYSYLQFDFWEGIVNVFRWFWYKVFKGLLCLESEEFGRFLRSISKYKLSIF